MAGNPEVNERRALRWKARTATLDALTDLGGEARRSALTQRARARGGFTARELEAAQPDGAGARPASPADHALSWALTSLRKDGLVENPQRGVWRLAATQFSRSRPSADSDVTIRRESVPPPGYREPAASAAPSAPTYEVPPRRAWSRLWRVLAG